MRRYRDDVDYPASSAFSRLPLRQVPASDRQVTFLRSLVDDALERDVWPRGFFWNGGHDLSITEASKAIVKFKKVLGRRE